MGLRNSKLSSSDQDIASLDTKRLQQLPYDIRIIISRYAISEYVNHCWQIKEKSMHGRTTGFICLYNDGVYQFQGDYSEGTLWLVYKESGRYMMETLLPRQQVVHITTDFLMNNSYKRTQACSPSVRTFTLSFPLQIEPYVFSFANEQFDYHSVDALASSPERFAALSEVKAPEDEAACFSGQSRVMLADGTQIPASSVVPGMSVRCRVVRPQQTSYGIETFLTEQVTSARVRKNVLSILHTPVSLVEMSPSLWLTRCHSVFLQGRWFHPEELQDASLVSVGSLVSLELSEHHNVLIEGHWVCCLGANVGARLVTRRPDLNHKYGTGYVRH